jgi:hypothetical protein
MKNYNSVVPGVPYSVTIAAVNKAGAGEFNEVIHFTRQLGTYIIMGSMHLHVCRCCVFLVHCMII